MAEGKLILPEPFSLGLTLLCGQCFRWEGPDLKGFFQGIAGQVYWRLRQEKNQLHWECGSEIVQGRLAFDWLSHYLCLDEDLEKWVRSLESDPILGEPLKQLSGLRLLRQDPWECTISYMFAQGLSVTVIRQALRKFCVEYGRLIPGTPGFYTFPEAESLTQLSPDFLKPFTNNYRARADRIIRMARVVEAKVISLEHLSNISCDNAREALMALDGIGPKIADCILLFSLGQASAFPVDRWVLRAMKKYFPLAHLLGATREAPTLSQYLKIVQKARAVFGDYCGLASEYLFLYLRLLEEEKLLRELSPFCQFTDRLSSQRTTRRSSNRT